MRTALGPLSPNVKPSKLSGPSKAWKPAKKELPTPTRLPAPQPVASPAAAETSPKTATPAAETSPKTATPAVSPPAEGRAEAAHAHEHTPPRRRSLAQRFCSFFSSA